MAVERRTILVAVARSKPDASLARSSAACGRSLALCARRLLPLALLRRMGG